MIKRGQSGQVLLTGITMMAVLLLIILYAFDVHNVMRAKMKVEIAQQAAAMTGANWQKESLNLIGEINLLKASALLLEGSENWKTPLPDRNAPENDNNENEKKWKEAMQARIDLLTEMQTRVSFIGPLIGFAAAQQAAKSNGLDGRRGVLGKYLELLEKDGRYIEEQGGAPKIINNYNWREPYRELVAKIDDSRIAVYPNARTAGMPETWPRQLANKKFYDEIWRCAEAIAAKDPPREHHWNLTTSILRTMTDKDFRRKWWTISYENNKFPNESEIFTLGVEFGDPGGDDPYKTVAEHFNRLAPSLQIYSSQAELPGSMKWCLYDDWWFVERYKERYPSEYESEHLNFWYNGEVLRDEVKPQYKYEGPAAYVEGYADVQSSVRVRPSVRPYANSRRRRNAKAAVKSRENSIFFKRSTTTSRVGTTRGEPDDSDVSTNYRPGSIAKVLGELDGETAPTAIEVILPVFKRVSPMPTFMPVPYGFQVLKPGYSKLEEFLGWLATQDNLDGTPPDGTQYYLDALRLLANGVQGRRGSKERVGGPLPDTSVCGEALRYYGYNPDFDKGAWETEFKDRLYDWKAVRDKRVFQQPQTTIDAGTYANLSAAEREALRQTYKGPGWLQEPKLFSNSPVLEKHETVIREIPAGEVFTGPTITVDGKRYEVSHFALKYGDESKYRPIRHDTHKVEVRDTINGGTAVRVYVNVKKGASQYYVINSRGRIVLNGENDPTILYNQWWARPGGEGGGTTPWNPGSYDNQRGPRRI